MRKSFAICIATLLAAKSAFAVSIYDYHAAGVTDLGTLDGGTDSAAYGINDLGDVVGWATASDGKHQAMIYTGGTMYSLHDASVPFYSAKAYAINNQRMVVGDYRLPPTGNRTKAFYYYPGIWLTPMHSNPMPWLSYSWDASAYSINGLNTIVGLAYRRSMPGDPPVPVAPVACYDALPVMWSNTGVIPDPLYCIADPDLDTYSDGGRGVASWDINNSGNIVGTDAVTSTHGMFFYNSSTSTRYSVPPIAGFPTTLSNGIAMSGYALGVNDSNRVVGGYGYEKNPNSAVPAASIRAFYWNGVSSKSIDLGFLGGGENSLARKINNGNFVVGYSEREYYGIHTHAAFIWHAHFGMKQLPALSFTGVPPELTPRECEAYALSELRAGIIRVAGYCYNSSGDQRAVRWDVKIGTTDLVL